MAASVRPGAVRVLPDSVANQIAAGEVVERPASVVKELVENALDAGASRIDIDIEAGGRRLIRVADDGCGMVRRDAILALERHATSKIEHASDLAGVATLGFRGEALPSVVAVSRTVIDTRAEDEAVGTRVKASGGVIVSVADHARTCGTTVEVRSLFFNAPARAKFMKSAAAEARVTAEVVTGLAVANFPIGFALRSGRRALLDLAPAESALERVKDLWGEKAETLIELAAEADGYTLRGLAQRPDAARPGGRRAYLVVGARPVREPRLLRAAERGYLTTIPEGAVPWVFLYLEAPTGYVDVNVHPAKAEVRFRELRRVEELVESAVRDAMRGVASGASFADGRTDAYTPDGRPRTEPGGVAEGGGRGYRGGFAEGGHGRHPDPGTGDQAAAGERRRTDADLFGPGRPTHLTGSHPTEAGRSPSPRMWQALNTYILAEVTEGLLVVDQHSAHERVLFHRLMARFRRGGAESQRLLFPVTARLSRAEFAQVLELSSVLAAAGFETDVFGVDTVILRGAPNPHPYFDAERAFLEMVGELAAGSELVRSARNQYEKIAMTFACKGAIKAGQPLAEAEMRELFDQLFATDLPYHDVHGRPTIVRLQASEIARRFGR